MMLLMCLTSRINKIGQIRNAIVSISKYLAPVSEIRDFGFLRNGEMETLKVGVVTWTSPIESPLTCPF